MKSASRKPQPKRKYFKSRGFSRLFCFSWEQRKAKGLFNSTADKGYPELPVLSATQDRGMIRRDENSINIFHDKKNESGYKRVLPGQFVIHLRSFQGGFAHSTIEGITSPAYTVFGFSEPEKHDSEYWKYVFTSKEFIRRLETVTYGIRDGRSISYDEFLTLDFVYPSKAEQTAIARYLDKLSDLITLHQRDSIMRFFGAWDNANAWEQRKLGDCFDERNESMPDGELISVTINDGIRKFSELGRHDNSNDDKSKYKKVCVGDIAYNSMRMWQGASGYSPYEGIVSPAYTVLSPKTGVVSRCLAYQFKLPEMIHTFQVNSQGITSDNWNLKYPAFSEIEIAIAKQVKEQELIASFFTSLDNLITLHQRERKNRLFGGKNVKQYNFSRLVLQLLRAMDSRLQRRGSSQGDYG